METLSTPVSGRYQGLVLRLIRDRGPRSRTDLTADTGLSPTTISKAVAPLVERGWLSESDGGETNGRVGRPAITLRQEPSAITVCGVSISVGFAKIGLADGWSRLREFRRIEFDVDVPATEALDRVVEMAANLLEDAPDCLGIGVAAPGPVDAAQRSNLLSINLGWRDGPVADHLERRLGMPVTVDHNVRAMALAEARYGAHRVQDMAFVHVGSGTGLGVVLKGEPFYGGSHGVSELGHIRARRGGQRCACGSTGCLETLMSEPYLRRQLDDLGVEPGPPVMQRLEHARDDVDGVAELRTELIDKLSRGLASVVNLLNPRQVILGGEFVDAPESLVTDIRRALRDAVFPLLRDEVELVRPTLEEAGLQGGAALALEKLVYSDVD